MTFPNSTLASHYRLSPRELRQIENIVREREDDFKSAWDKHSGAGKILPARRHSNNRSAAGASVRFISSGLAVSSDFTNSPAPESRKADPPM